MGNLLSSLPKTIHASLALAIIFFLGLFYGNGGFDFDTIFWSWLTRLIHVTVAIMWIGLQHYQSQKQEDISQADFLLMLKVEDVKLVKVMV